MCPIRPAPEASSAVSSQRRDRRCASPVALALFDAFAASGEAERLTLWRAVDRELADRGLGSACGELDLSEAVDSMRRAIAAADHDGCLSRRDYTVLRRERPELGLVAPSTIEKRVSWGRLAEMVGARPPVDPAAAELRGWGAPFARAELEAALRLAAESLDADDVDSRPGVLSAKRYVKWAKGQDHAALDVRVPLSLSPFERHGGFLAVRASALRGCEAQLRVERLDLERAELRDGIGQAAQELGRNALTFTDLRSWAETRDEESAESSVGLRCSLVTRYKVRELYGDWDSACRAAGIRAAARSGGSPASPGGSRDHYSREQLIRRVAQIAAARPRGGYLTKAQFLAGQRDAAAAAERGGRAYRTYSLEVICRRFGNWPNACHAAGLIDERERRRLNASGFKPVSDARIREVIKQAAHDLGNGPQPATAGSTHKQGEAELDPRAGPTRPTQDRAGGDIGFSRARYDRWVREQIQNAADDAEAFPVSRTVADRLGAGSFHIAVRDILFPDPSAQHATGGDNGGGPAAVQVSDHSQAGRISDHARGRS